MRQRKPGAEAGLYYAASLLTQVSLLENGRTWLDSWKSKESCCFDHQLLRCPITTNLLLYSSLEALRSISFPSNE